MIKAAVIAALPLPFSNGQVEGQVNRLKVIKRCMYGRRRDTLTPPVVLPGASSVANRSQPAVVTTGQTA